MKDEDIKLEEIEVSLTLVGYGRYPSFRTFSLKRMDHTDIKSKDFSSVNKTLTYCRCYSTVRCTIDIHYSQ